MHFTSFYQDPVEAMKIGKFTRKSEEYSVGSKTINTTLICHVNSTYLQPSGTNGSSPEMQPSVLSASGDRSAASARSLTSLPCYRLLEPRSQGMFQLPKRHTSFLLVLVCCVQKRSGRTNA
ncbi:hypothetical protein RHMOL_Rhmol06G0044500 [Rhododendron molle]|uniref:Uncharacterized protein n=1 Tax=Rhododendron molle TaxID=49168 RepID=A0ACC0N9D1_RHOML|nr:hypothetical protein RHMOL_Rhmol06G0044500 [Rhododendron molle]